MVGVPQAIEMVPEFVTGRQLYNYIAKHFKKTISNPIAVGELNMDSYLANCSEYYAILT